jgi:hypothetical protein
VEKDLDGSSIDVEIIVGRDHEQRLLSVLVDSLSVGGGAVAILGEPGMGKDLVAGIRRRLRKAPEPSSSHVARD